MEQIAFDPKKHLSRSDQERLNEMAKAMGMSPADFIETVLKKTIFSQPFPKLQPKEAV